MTAKAPARWMPHSAGDIITISLARNGLYVERAEPAFKENGKGSALPWSLPIAVRSGLRETHKLPLVLCIGAASIFTRVSWPVTGTQEIWPSPGISL